MKKVQDYLRHGTENAVNATVLAATMGVSTRKLRSQIMQEREGGALILYAPGKGGYFLPSANPERAQQELSAFYNVQVARCKHGLKALTPVARALKIPIGQQEFDSR